MLTYKTTITKEPVTATTLTLVEPNLDLALEFLAMAYDFRRENTDFLPEPIYDLAGYIRRAQDYAVGVNLPAGYVPATEYWLLRSDGIIVGKANLRHRLNDDLARSGGHIDYAIRPTQRKKGYCAVILKLTLEKARRLGLPRVLVTCDAQKRASAQIIRNSGGLLENELTIEGGTRVSHYWIDLHKQ